MAELDNDYDMWTQITSTQRLFLSWFYVRHHFKVNFWKPSRNAYLEKENLKGQGTDQEGRMEECKEKNPILHSGKKAGKG